jgi:hypothetical protein
MKVEKRLGSIRVAPWGTFPYLLVVELGKASCYFLTTGEHYRIRQGLFGNLRGWVGLGNNVLLCIVM